MPAKKNRFLLAVSFVTGGPVVCGAFDSFQGSEVSGEAEQEAYHASVLGPDRLSGNVSIRGRPARS